MHDATAILRQIREYEENLHVACTAPRLGRVVPLQCDAFSKLYFAIARDAKLGAIARRLVHSHWAASDVISMLASRARAAHPALLQELVHVRGEIHGHLRAIRRSVARSTGADHHESGAVGG